MIFKRRTLTWITGLMLVFLLAACEGLAGEPVVVSTLPPSQADAQKQASIDASMPQPAATEDAGAQTANVVAPSTEPDLALGATLFAENCTRCHGVNGQGDGELVKLGQVQAPLDFTDPATIAGKTPQDYYTIITNGKLDTLMPPWANKLSDDQRWAVANYVYSMSSGAPAVPQVAGVIKGQVTNASAGGTVPAGLAVQLHIVNQDFTSEETVDGVIAEDGTFQFADIAMKSDMGYAVTVEYNDTTFASEILAGDTAALALDLPVQIYEATDDPSVLAIDAMSTQISVNDGELTVIEILSFVNNSDKMYRKADGQSSVTITVPEGATLTQFSQQGDRYLYSEDGRQVSDVFPVVPGQRHTFHLLYTIPYNSEGVSLTQTLDYPLSAGFEVLLDTPGLNITGDTIAPLGGSTTDSPHGAVMRFGNESALAAGQPITFVVAGEPQVAAVVPDSADTTATTVPQPPAIPVLAYIFITLGAISVAGAGFLFYKERQLMRAGAGSVPAAKAPAVGVEQARINALVKQIADLDQNHQDGKIKGSAYEKQRKALKTELMTLIQQSNQN